MRAVVVTKDGRLDVDTVGEPVAGDHQAVVEVAAFSINRGETYLIEAAAPGWRPGKDLAGTVITPAVDGSGPPPGTRVVGRAPHSAWAQRVAVDTAGLTEVPDTIALSTAAALPLAGLTALRLIRRAGSLIGRRLLVTGASGGVGHYLVELAMAAGAEVTAVTATHERGARLRAFGATTVRSVTETTGWFDVTFESVGGDTFVEARRRARPSGTVLWFGQAGGRPITLDFPDWIDGTVGATIEAFHYETSTEPPGFDLRTLVHLVATERLHPEIGVLLPWDQTARAVDELRARTVRGHAVLEVVAA